MNPLLATTFSSTKTLSPSFLRHFLILPTDVHIGLKLFKIQKEEVKKELDS